MMLQKLRQLRTNRTRIFHQMPLLQDRQRNLGEIPPPTYAIQLQPPTNLTGRLDVRFPRPVFPHPATTTPPYFDTRQNPGDNPMIYALNTRDVSDHERRAVARLG